MEIPTNNIPPIGLTSIRQSWIIAFLLIFSANAVSAKKDSLFLKPNILIEYERGPWKGPSGGEPKYRKQNNYKRFCNEHYLYTGWSEHAALERNWLLYNEIVIRSGYLDELPLAHVKKNTYLNEREYYQSVLKSIEDPFDSNAIEINRERRNVNGYSYEFMSLKRLTYGLTGDKMTWHYFRVAKLDTVFSDGTFMRIHTETYDGSFDFLEKRIEKLVHIK
ncbi:MAG: hypothetical protein ACKVOK_11395, partial [Flavobacteriales bacterium]